MLHAAPPPAMPRSVVGGWPTGVIESNAMSLSPPPSAPTLTVPAPSKLKAPIAPTANFRQCVMTNLPEPRSRLRGSIPGRVTSAAAEDRALDHVEDRDREVRARARQRVDEGHGGGGQVQRGAGQVTAADPVDHLLVRV